jgi:hypothetical protein
MFFDVVWAFLWTEKLKLVDNSQHTTKKWIYLFAVKKKLVVKYIKKYLNQINPFPMIVFHAIHILSYSYTQY